MYIRRNSLIILFLFCSAFVCSQNEVTLAEIKPYENKIDFSFLKSEVINKRVVLLGENTHWDGASLKAKNEIIKFLHDSLGYNILLYESDFFGVYRAYNDILEKKESPLLFWSFLIHGFPNEEFDYEFILGNYLEKCFQNDNPLVLSGIDVLGGYSYGCAFFTEIPEFCKNLDSNYLTSKWREYFEKLGLKGLRESFLNEKKYTEWIKQINYNDLENCSILFNEYLTELEDKENNYLIKRKLQFYQQAVKSYIGGFNQLINSPDKKLYKSRTILSYYAIRDSLMAENVKWYLDKYYPNEKIIISASAYHISRNLSTIKPLPKDLGNQKSMGDYLFEIYGDSLYSIAFISYSGTYGVLYSPNSISNIIFNVPKKNKYSLEYILHKKGYKNCFFDLDNIDLPHEYYMFPTLVEPHKANWSCIYDGVFFIDKMYPVEMVYLNKRFDLKPPYDIPSEYFKDGKRAIIKFGDF